MARSEPNRFGCVKGFLRTLALMARTTLADVAREAGVSRTTASHALSGKGRVDSGTRALVREVADRLGYSPSRVARNLALGRSDTIGLLLPSIGQLPLDELARTDWYGRVAVLASQEALALGRALTILPPIRSTSDLAAFGLDGVLVLDPVEHDPRWPALREIALPRVLIGRDPAGELGPTVVTDLVGPVAELFSHLRSQGMHRIGLVMPDFHWSAEDEVASLVRVHCATWGLPEPTIIHVDASAFSSRAEALDRTQEVVIEALQGPDRPDALVGLFEGAGPAIMMAARALGLEVPSDLLVAVDVDGIVAESFDPPITAIDLNIEDLVTNAVQLLVSDEGIQTSEVTVTVPARLMLRASTQRLVD